MSPLLAVHIASGVAAIGAGSFAATVRKGGRWHARSGTVFFAAMLVLGATAALLEPLRDPPGSPIAGLFVIYFVTTSWVTARRRDGRTGRFEYGAAAVALATAALMLIGTSTGASRTPVGNGPVYALAGLCALAGALDLKVAIAKVMTPAQRLRRHLWRMLFAFFIATGSFFLGQQQVFPAALRGSPILFGLALLPFAVMAFWLVRLSFAKPLAKLFGALA